MKRRSICVGVFVGVFFLGIGFAQAYSNLALSGTASQSSLYGDDYASKAIDDNTNGNWHSDSVTHTMRDYQAWWQVDLKDMYAIDEIVIWNRTDDCPERLTDFTVSILDENDAIVWSDVYYALGGHPTPSLKIDLSGLNINGQTVKISLNGTNYLSLAEVQVMGDSNPVPLPGSALLFGSGLIGLLGIRRKKKALRVKSGRP